MTALACPSPALLARATARCATPSARRAAPRVLTRKRPASASRRCRVANVTSVGCRGFAAALAACAQDTRRHRPPRPLSAKTAVASPRLWKSRLLSRGRRRTSVALALVGVASHYVTVRTASQGQRARHGRPDARQLAAGHCERGIVGGGIGCDLEQLYDVIFFPLFSFPVFHMTGREVGMALFCRAVSARLMHSLPPDFLLGGHPRAPRGCAR